MPEEQTQSDNTAPATESSPQPEAMSQASAGSKTIDLPIAANDVVSLRITIDFQRQPQGSGDGPIFGPSAVGGGSLDQKEVGRVHPSRHSAEG